MEKQYRKIANVEEVESGKCKLFQMHGVSVALFNAAGAFYAVQDYCPGDGGSLSEGTLIGSAVMCASDKALFYLPTGECVDPQHLPRLAVYEVRIAGEEITVVMEEARPDVDILRPEYATDQLPA